MKNQSYITRSLTIAILMIITSSDFSQTDNIQQLRCAKTIDFNDLNAIGAVAVSHDDQLLFIGGAKEVGYYEWENIGYIYSLQTNEIKLTFLEHPGAIENACYSLDNKKIATAGYPFSVWYWDVNSGEVLQQFKTRATISPFNVGSIRGLDFFQDGIRMIAGDASGNIHIWNLITGEELLWSHYYYTGGGVTQIKELKLFQNDEKVLVSAGSTPAEVRSTKDGKYLFSIGADKVAIDPEERYFLGTIVELGTKNRIINRYDINTGEVIEKVSTYTPTGVNQIFSPDGKFLVSDNSIDKNGLSNVTDVMSGKIISELTADKAEIVTEPDIIKFSPSGKRLVVTKKNMVCIYDMAEITAGIKSLN